MKIDFFGRHESNKFNHERLGKLHAKDEKLNHILKLKEKLVLKLEVLFLKLKEIQCLLLEKC